MAIVTPLNIYSADKNYLIFDTPTGAVGERCIQFLSSCGASCVCEFKKIRKRRTTGINSQNHHFYGHVMQIARELGMCSPSEIEQLKTYIKQVAHIMFNYPAKEIKPGVWIYQSESDCDTVEEGYLIEASHWVASDLNIILIETE